MRLILASASPRRAELLTAAGFQFETRAADIDESPLPNESAPNYTLRVATEKAHTVNKDVADTDATVLAADTEVVIDAAILGKPLDHDDARRMLKLMAGRTHEVLTAVVVLTRSSQQECIVSTLVHFLPLSDHEIDGYVRTGEPMGKAGAYAIQGYAARFIDRIEGSWSNVVGLPIHAVHELIGRTRTS